MLLLPRLFPPRAARINAFVPRRDPTPGLALALLSQRILPRHVQHLTRKKASGWRSLLVLGATDGDFHEAGDEIKNKGPVAGKDGRGGGGAAGEGGGEIPMAAEEVCPLTGFDIGAVEWSMPGRLREAAAAEGGAARGAEAECGAAPQPFPALRIWVRPLAAPARAQGCLKITHSSVMNRKPPNPLLPQTTMLCAAALRGLDESFLLSTREAQGFEETVVDRAMGYLDAQCEEFPRLAEARGALLKEAAETVAAWETRHVRRKRRLRLLPHSARKDSARHSHLSVAVALMRFSPRAPSTRSRASWRQRRRWAAPGDPSEASSSRRGSRVRGRAGARRRLILSALALHLPQPA